MSKMAKKDKIKPEQTRNRLKGLGFALGSNLAATGVVYGSMIGQKKPRPISIVKKEMNIKTPTSKIDLKTSIPMPMASYNPDSHKAEVNIPRKAPESVVAHELGHVKNRDIIHSISNKMFKTERGKLWGRRIGWHLPVNLKTPTLLSLAASGIANDDDAKGQLAIPATVAAINAPLLAEEGMANVHALKHLVTKHGIPKGLLKSVPLAGSYGSYLSLGALPLGIALYRRHKKKKNQQIKISSIFDELSKTSLNKKASIKGKLLGLGAAASMYASPLAKPIRDVHSAMASGVRDNVLQTLKSKKIGNLPVLKGK